MKIILEYSYSTGKWIYILTCGRELITVLDAKEVQEEVNGVLD